MATLCSKLTQCLSTTKHLYWKKQILNMHSVNLFPWKSQVIQLQNVPANKYPVVICYVMFSTQTTSDQPVGNVIKQAELGFKSGGKNYDSNRPSYTDESVDLIVSEIVSTLKTIPVADIKYDVLELGAGTGKLTEQLSKKLPENTKYLASEPSENFLGVLQSKGLNVDATIATADNIPLEDRSVGNVVCAQCFHWFSDKKNLKSIRRVLVPEGKLILIWNMKQFDHDWMTIFYEQRKEIVQKVDGSIKFLVNSGEWCKDIDVSKDFKLLSYKSLEGINFHGDVETILANITTISAYNALPAVERDAYVDKLRQGLKSWPGLDVKNITVPFTTELYVYVAQ